MTDPHQSHAFHTLRPSARRILQLIESEIARQNGLAVVYVDQLEAIGSRRTYRPALAELHALGLADVVKYPKRYVCKLSDRWREVRSAQAALKISAAARACGMRQATQAAPESRALP